MLIELHQLQSFAPSNLNRDDTGAPKDCLFGGVRRARISSQCIKRALRLNFQTQALITPDELGKRTKLIVEELKKRLAGKGTQESVEAVAIAALEGTGLKAVEGKTQYLVFWGPDEVTKLVDICKRHWDELVVAAGGGGEEQELRGKKKKQKLGENLSKELKGELESVLGYPKAVDIGLFGRMLADLPDKNVDAACQVAHALSTHRVEMEFDYFTAVDDLQERESEEGAGAGMIGTVSFNSACYYRYANIRVPELVRNLGGDSKLAERAVAAFIQAAVEAIPTGKQNTFAAQNPPSFVLVVKRPEGQPLSLANAFECPVRYESGGGYIVPSIKALDAYWGRVSQVYGLKNAETAYLVLEDLTEKTLVNLPPAGQVGSAAELITRARQGLTA